MSNGTVIEACAASNNSRNPVIQQIIVQPTELLPVLPAPDVRRDPPKDVPNSAGTFISWFLIFSELS